MRLTSTYPVLGGKFEAAAFAHRPLGALGVTGVQQFPRVSGGNPDDPLGQACSEWTRHCLLVFLLALTHR